MKINPLVFNPWQTLLLALLCCGFIDNSMAASAVGKTITVKGTVLTQPKEGQPYYIGKGSELFPGDTITTAKKSFAVLEFIDEAKIVVRQNSVFVVEGYSYQEGSDESTLKLVKGGIRALTGAIARQNPDNFTLDTPVAALGVRGTRFDARICDDDCAEEEKELASTERAFAPADSGCTTFLRFEGLPPGGYFTIHDGRVFLKKGEEILELGAGDVAYANEKSLGCLPEVPNFLLDEQTPSPDTDDFRAFSPLQCDA